jgi:parallel beta-helix repeat protein
MKVLIGLALAGSLAVTGCSSSDSDSDGGNGGSGGSAGSGGTAGSGGVGGGGPPGGGGTGGSEPVEISCDTDIPDASSYVVDDVWPGEVPATTTDDCTDNFEPGDNNAGRLNALIDGNVDGVICLAPGTYEMDDTINVSRAPGLTIKGTGESPDDTLLIFGGPGSGIGIFVQNNDVTVENIWVKNTGANGIEQDGTTGSVFRKVHVSWDDFCDQAVAPENCGNECTEDGDCGDSLLACGDEGTCVGDQGKNGAYGIYPTNCENTLVEWSQATSASDAGIYIGKCGWLDDSTTGGLVHHNIAANNVAGLEVENCLDVVARDNFVFGNTGGLMPLQQPISESRPANTGVLMENNRVYCNNGENFAETGVVQIIPVGSGIVSLGGQGVEMRNNDIQGNDSYAAALVSSSFTCDAAGADCPPYSYEYNPYAQQIYLHDNFMLNNGTNADLQSDFGLIFFLLGYGSENNPVPDVIFDGNLEEEGVDPEICLGADYTGTYVDMTQNQCRFPADVDEFAACLVENSTEDTAGRLCDLEMM